MHSPRMFSHDIVTDSDDLFCEAKKVAEHPWTQFLERVLIVSLEITFSDCAGQACIGSHPLSVLNTPTLEGIPRITKVHEPERCCLADFPYS